MPEMKNAGQIAAWTFGVLVAGAMARIGWEIGGKLWAVF